MLRTSTTNSGEPVFHTQETLIWSEVRLRDSCFAHIGSSKIVPCGAFPSSEDQSAQDFEWLCVANSVQKLHPFYTRTEARKLSRSYPAYRSQGFHRGFRNMGRGSGEVARDDSITKVRLAINCRRFGGDAQVPLPECHSFFQDSLTSCGRCLGTLGLRCQRHSQQFRRRTLAIKELVRGVLAIGTMSGCAVFRMAAASLALMSPTRTQVFCVI